MAVSHVIVGLGNPGGEYEGTRHNAGFMVVDRIAERNGAAPIRDRRYGALVAKAILRRGGQEAEVLLVKPQGYMNLSGEPVKKAVQDVGLAPDQWTEKLIVVHDELDLPAGRLKLQTNRGAGGHNGIKSIIGSLGTNGFARIRFGVDKPPRGPDGKPLGVDWVLSGFSKSEWKTVEPALDLAAEAAEAAVLEGFQKAANRYNAEPSREPKQEGQQGSTK